MKTQYLYTITLLWIGVFCVAWRVARAQALLLAVAERLGRALEALAQHPKKAFGLLFILSFCLNVLLGLCVGIPQPFIHDEFAYLFAAETFAQGRLTNPTPVGWEHFEAVHLLLRPTYMARYLPGGGLVLALGQVLTGYPIVGVWCITALCVALTFWALLPMVSARTAFLVALLLLLCPQMRTWGQSYWGGSLAVCGGALVLGAGLRFRVGGALGLGVALLLLSRPFEGAIFCLILLIYLRPQSSVLTLTRQDTLACLVPLVGTVAFLLIYNHAVTGSFRELPYLHYQREYDSAPTFAFQAEFPPKLYHSRFVADFWAYIAQGYHFARVHAPGTSVSKWVDFLQLIIGNPVLLLTLLYGLMQGLVKRECAILLGYFVVIVVDTFAWSHYAAPVLPFACLVVGLVLEKRAWSGGAPLLLIGAALLGYGGNVVAYGRWYRESRPLPILQKAALQKSLEREAQPVVVFLRYVPNQHGDLWLYNASVPQKAPVLWLSSLGEERDRATLAAYPGRKAFLLDIETQKRIPYLEEPKANR